MFKTLETFTKVAFTFESEPLQAPVGATVAGALLGNGITALRRTPVSGAARGPFCMMGTCFECLVRIDGINVQACQVHVIEGMVVTKVPVDEA